VRIHFSKLRRYLSTDLKSTEGRPLHKVEKVILMLKKWTVVSHIMKPIIIGFLNATFCSNQRANMCDQPVTGSLEIWISRKLVAKSWSVPLICYNNNVMGHRSIERTCALHASSESRMAYYTDPLSGMPLGHTWARQRRQRTAGWPRSSARAPWGANVLGPV
jgi:hypothetical protein